MIQLSETELSRLGKAFRGVTEYILRRILVNIEGVRLVDRIACSGSYEQDSEALATRTSPILAEDWRDICSRDYYPMCNVNADICDDTPSDSRATNETNPLTLFSNEQSMKLDGVELIEEDTLDLRKYRFWITEEGEYHQAVQKSNEVSQRFGVFTLLEKDMRQENIKAPSPTNKVRSKKKCSAKDAVSLVIEEVQTIEQFTHDAVPREPSKDNGLEDHSR